MKQPRPFVRGEPVASCVVDWLTELAKLHEFQPDVAHIHLSHPTRSAVYMEYVHCVKHAPPAQGLLPCDPGYFAKVWRSRCAHIKVRKLMRFSICDTCDKWRSAMCNAVSIPLRAELAAAQRVHLDHMRLERHAYWMKRHRARLNPAECISLICDGADQAKYKFPSSWSKVTLSLPLNFHLSPCSRVDLHDQAWVDARVSRRLMMVSSGSRCTSPESSRTAITAHGRS